MFMIYMCLALLAAGSGSDSLPLSRRNDSGCARALALAVLAGLKHHAPLNATDPVLKRPVFFLLAFPARPLPWLLPTHPPPPNRRTEVNLLPVGAVHTVAVLRVERIDVER
jgi:hypothetical protein